MYADYYQCYGPGTGFNINGGKGDPNLKPTCFSPTTTWNTVLEHNEHLQNEFRLSTPEDWRLRGIVGAYIEAIRTAVRSMLMVLMGCSSSSCRRGIHPTA